MRIIVSFVAVFSFFSAALYGQGTTGAIETLVTDSSGAAVPGAAVIAENVGTGAVFNAQSDAAGRASFPLLRPGRYRVTAEIKGFQKLERSEVIVNATETVRLDLKLVLGAVSETVTITAETPLLQSERATMGHVVEQRTITSIPLATRNFTQLLGTSPGVIGSIYNADQPGTGSDSVSVNGARRGSNNILVDGAPTSNALNNSPDGDGTPSLEFLSEFKVLTSLFGAEYGKNLGSIINVTTRSGSNEFHGSAYEFFRNTALNARPFFSPARGQNNQHQFGANLGGPVIKNKTFFFGGWESMRQRNANSSSASITRVVPTANQRAGNFGSKRLVDPLTGQQFPDNVIPASRLNPVSLKLQEMFVPLPNYSSGGAVNFFASKSLPTDLNQFTARVDHRFNDSNSFYVRWFDSRLEDMNPFYQGMPQFGRGSKKQKHSVTGSHTHVFSPTLILEAGAAYDQTDQFTFFENQTDPASVGMVPLPVTMVDDGLPEILITNYFNFGNYQRWSDYVKTATGTANFTYMRNQHNFKFGLESRHDLYNPQNTLTSRGRFSYTGDATGDAYADFLLSHTRSKAFGAGPGELKMRDAVLATYFSDEWKVNPRLTITMGVRYEAYWQPAAYNLGMTNWYPDLYRGVGSLEASGIVQGGVNGVPLSTVHNDMNNIMPRLGIAWRFADRWVIRTGAGLYFDQRVGQIAQQAFNNPPTFTSIQPDCIAAGSGCNLRTPDNWTFMDPGYNPDLIPFPASVNSSMSMAALERNIKTDNAWQYNFSLQRELPGNFLIETAYVGTKGTHLMSNHIANPQIPVGFDPGDPKPGTLVRLYPGFADMSINSQGGSSTYNSFQFTAKKRISTGTVQASYTWSKTIGNGSEDTRFFTSMALAPWWDWSRARGPANFDRTHRLSVMFTQDLPKFFDAGVGRRLFNDWSVNGMFIAQTGTPVTVTNRTSGQGLGGAATSSTAALYSNVAKDADLTTPGSTKDNLRNYINKAAWSPAPAGTVGTSGRGMFRAPGQSNLDVSLFKNIPIRESIRLEFRSEFFNIFNRANFGGPNASMDAGNFGQITSTTVNARLVQFALKLSF